MMLPHCCMQGGMDIGADGVLGFGARQEQMVAAKAEKRARLEADLKQQIVEKQARRVRTNKENISRDISRHSVS